MQIDFNDLILVQSAYGLNSRTDATIEYIPIISAPMDSVISLENAELFREQGVNICYPRGLAVEPNEIDFVSMGLNDFQLWLDGEKDLNGKKICLDVANGNMPQLHHSVIQAKIKWPNIIIMAGNVASETAFKALAQTGCDYIRVGVGSGSGCLTSVHTAVGQGLATLITRCVRVRQLDGLSTMIVADGGFQSYRDIILALAVGADYVMLGGILNKCFESAGEKIVRVNRNTYNSIMRVDKYSDFYQHLEQKELNLTEFEDYCMAIDVRRGTSWTNEPNFYQTNIDNAIKEGVIFSKFRGMSTKAVQLEWGKTELRSSEGIEKINKVEYKIEGWMDNLKNYLRSSMSYCGCYTLEEFKTTAQVEQISPAVYTRFNK